MSRRTEYECHITFEPVEGERLDLLKAVCKTQDFRVAELLMMRNRAPTNERSDLDSFATAKDESYMVLQIRARRCVSAARASGFQVWRVKIERTLMDRRYDAAGNVTHYFIDVEE